MCRQAAVNRGYLVTFANVIGVLVHLVPRVVKHESLPELHVRSIVSVGRHQINRQKTNSSSLYCQHHRSGFPGCETILQRITLRRSGQ